MSKRNVVGLVVTISYLFSKPKPATHSRVSNQRLELSVFWLRTRSIPQGKHEIRQNCHAGSNTRRGDASVVEAMARCARGGSQRALESDSGGTGVRHISSSACETHGIVINLLGSPCEVSHSVVTTRSDLFQVTEARCVSTWQIKLAIWHPAPV